MDFRWRAKPVLHSLEVGGPQNRPAVHSRPRVDYAAPDRARSWDYPQYAEEILPRAGCSGGHVRTPGLRGPRDWRPEIENSRASASHVVSDSSAGFPKGISLFAA